MAQGGIADLQIAAMGGMHAVGLADFGGGASVIHPHLGARHTVFRVKLTCDIDRVHLAKIGGFLCDCFKAAVDREGGGKLFITAAHLRDSIERDKKGNFVEGLDELLGVKLSEETFRCNDGFKFIKNSTVDGVMYPGTASLNCDPAWSAGYTNYVKTEITTATPVCYVTDCFLKDEEYMYPVVTENKYGKGDVIFMATSEYPGAGEVYPLYKLIVKQLLAASHRTSDLKVIGSDKLRFAMYEGEDSYKLYLLNTDFNFENRVKVIFRGEETERVVRSLGLEIIEYKK